MLTGGHRLLAELGGWVTSLAGLTETCPLADFDRRLAEINRACCTEEKVEGDALEDGECIDGVPTSCPYRCGRVWTAFHDQCWALVTSFSFYDEGGHFERLSDRCLDVDPVSMALALYDADCSVCGDGDINGAEMCDDGGANSNAPDAACRTNCQLKRCGDEVVDAGEDCDDGPRNADREGDFCRLDCKNPASAVTSCAEVARAGIFTITPADTPSFQARCDPDGFMKVLQVHSAAYTPTPGTLGGDAILQCDADRVDAGCDPSTPITTEAKLSDAQINSVGAGAKIFKLVSPGEGSEPRATYFIHSESTYVDTAAHMGLQDTTDFGSNDCTRIFFDYSDTPGCYPATGTGRCFNDGVTCGHTLITDFEMWVKREP